MINSLIAAVVGSVLASVTLVGGVNLYQSSSETEPVSSSDLYTYADE
ncbi:hypothetical protein [Nocardioides pacificus]